jgi:hypothetical protein
VSSWAGPRVRRTGALGALHQASAPGVGSGVTDRAKNRLPLRGRERPAVEGQGWFKREPRRFAQPVRVVLEADRLPKPGDTRAGSSPPIHAAADPRPPGQRRVRGAAAAWWKAAKIDGVTMAHRLWQHTRLNGAPIQEHIDPLLGAPSEHGVGDGGTKPSAGLGDP